MSFSRFFGHDIDFDKAATMFTEHHLLYSLFALLAIFLTYSFADKIKKSPKLRQEMVDQGYAHAQKFSESYIAKTITSLYKRTLNDSSNSHHTYL